MAIIETRAQALATLWSALWHRRQEDYSTHAGQPRHCRYAMYKAIRATITPIMTQIVLIFVQRDSFCSGTDSMRAIPLLSALAALIVTLCRLPPCRTTFTACAVSSDDGINSSSLIVARISLTNRTSVVRI